MFGHPLELAIVFIIGLIVFGPKKLPEITRNVGRGINAFRKGIDGFNMQGEDVDELAMVARRRELAELELQIVEKKAEMVRQELQLRQMETANEGTVADLATVNTDSASAASSDFSNPDSEYSEYDSSTLTAEFAGTDEPSPYTTQPEIPINPTYEDSEPGEDDATVKISKDDMQAAIDAERILNAEQHTEAILQSVPQNPQQ
jgi:Sec-independent protein secretion pathway components